ncbi:hypothetical protein AMATHDRAFT_168445, partial [Amanita thiersii Skay4041]
VWLSDKSYILATGIGQVQLDLNIGGGKSIPTIIQNIYYVPELNGNLISISSLAK